MSELPRGLQRFMVYLNVEPRAMNAFADVGIHPSEEFPPSLEVVPASALQEADLERRELTELLEELLEAVEASEMRTAYRDVIAQARAVLPEPDTPTREDE